MHERTAMLWHRIREDRHLPCRPLVSRGKRCVRWQGLGGIAIGWVGGVEPASLSRKALLDRGSLGSHERFSGKDRTPRFLMLILQSKIFFL